MAPFRFERRGRNWRTVAAVAAVWAVLAALRLWLDAALWVLAVPAAATLPGLWELATDRRAGLELDASALRWHAGRIRGEVAVTKISRVRFVTRLDLSVRAAIVLEGGRQVRLPQECVPPLGPFRRALAARGIPDERHHFSLS